MNIHIKSILSALAFSLLLYNKSFGLNLFLISILAIVLLTTIRSQRPLPWVFITAHLFSAAMVFVNPSGFSVFVYFVTLSVMAGKSMVSKTSLYLSGFLGFASLMTASLGRLSERPQEGEDDKPALPARALVYLKGALLAALFVFVFALLYRRANPIFEELIAEIDFSFISFPWLLFTVLGYFLFRHLLAPYYPKKLVEADLSASNELRAPKEPLSEQLIQKLRNETTLGRIVFVALNGLLVFFLATDVIYLLNQSVTRAAQYSESVHEGVYALMLSIVCAIGIILYFFRGNLNFIAENRGLRSLTYVWIGLNIVLIALTFYKNYLYVDALGLTYKRIGVFVYLLATLSGLVTTYIKVTEAKNFLFLIRTNAIAAFSFLTLASGIPWDKTITNYNLSHLERPDMAYLIRLGTTNAPQLYTYAKENSQALVFGQAEAIDEKYQRFSDEQADKSWQEYTSFQLTLNRQE